MISELPPPIFKPLFLLSVLLFLVTEKNLAKNPTTYNSNTNWMQFFPGKLSFIKLGESTKEEVIKKLGEPSETDENQNLFYELSGIKYDTTIGIKENKVFHIIYSPPGNSLSLKDLEPYIPQLILDQAITEPENRVSTHLLNKNYYIRWPEQGITITVRKNSRESIESLLLYLK